MTKKLVWVGFFMGSTMGGYVPSLWGGGSLSMSAVLLSFVGGMAGIWLGYRFGR